MNRNLDSIDWKIISALHLDGRKTFKSLGREVGFTGLGARKRVEKLLGQRIIQISALVNIEKLDMFLAMIFLELESAEAIRNVIERYNRCPRVINFFTTMGGYNLIALVLAEDQGTLESESMEKCSLRSGEGIRRSEFFPINKVHYSAFLPLRTHIGDREGDITPCGVDCRDCPSFQSQKCLGCPSSNCYKGSPEK
ncbi:MAG: AsnC family transcriptional regulator [Candidatus Bathyarchaeota archaeon]